MGYVQANLDAVATMLAACADFQTLVGAGNATEALGAIVKTADDDGRRGNFAVLFADKGDDEEPAFGALSHRGEVVVRLTIADLDNEPAATRAARIRDKADAIRTQLYAQRGASGKLARFTIDIEGPRHFVPTHAKAGHSNILLVISYQG